MKRVDIEALAALREKATPGKWMDYETVVGVDPDVPLSGIIADLYCDAMGHMQPEREANTALIVAAVNSLPDMLDELRALREVVSEVERWTTTHDGDPADYATIDRDGMARLRAALARVPS